MRNSLPHMCNFTVATQADSKYTTLLLSNSLSTRVVNFAIWKGRGSLEAQEVCKTGSFGQQLLKRWILPGNPIECRYQHCRLVSAFSFESSAIGPIGSRARRGSC